MWPYNSAESDQWQMALGERAVIEGVLARLRPRLAVELGTAEGGSLEAIAEQSEEVHTFDFEPRVRRRFDNVTFHRGDSHVLLPRLLRELAGEGRNVDFVLMDGDHSPPGVRRDLEDLLSSGAVKRTVILLHDTMNEGVRTGIEAIDFRAYQKVRYVDPYFVTLAQDPHPLEDLWGGIGMIVVDDASPNARQTIKQGLPFPTGIRTFAWRLAAPARRILRRLRPLARTLRDLRAHCDQ